MPHDGQEDCFGQDKRLPLLFEQVYRDLRRVAHCKMSGEPDTPSLQTTELVHRAYEKLFRGRDIDWNDSKHVFCAAARAMRYILIDAARARARRVPKTRFEASLSEVLADPHTPLLKELARKDETECLERALERFERIDRRDSEVVDLHFYSGLSIRDIAERLSMTKSQVETKLKNALAWFRCELPCFEEWNG